MHFIAHAHWEDQVFELPDIGKRQWLRLVDTALPSPQDIADEGASFALSQESYPIRARAWRSLSSDEALVPGSRHFQKLPLAGLASRNRTNRLCRYTQHDLDLAIAQALFTLGVLRFSICSGRCIP